VCVPPATGTRSACADPSKTAPIDREVRRPVMTAVRLTQYQILSIMFFRLSTFSSAFRVSDTHHSSHICLTYVLIIVNY